MKRASFFLLILGVAAGGADLRLGIIGTDTSHAPAFTKLVNDPSVPGHVPGARVVAAFPGGSDDVESSRTRVAKYAEELKQQYGVQMVQDIPTLCRMVDGVLLLSVDGRTHLAQARQVFAARKPVFIDKPLASTLADAREISRLAAEAGVPWFSSSSLRYGELAELRSADARGYEVWGPAPFEEHHQLDLSWYGIHPVELLYTLMGPGCVEVTRVTSENSDVIVGRWKDGRLGTVRALRPYSDYGVLTFGPKETARSDAKAKAVEYGRLVERVLGFFRTGTPPVPNWETLEIFSFLDAAQRSKEAGGAAMKLR